MSESDDSTGINYIWYITIAVFMIIIVGLYASYGAFTVSSTGLEEKISSKQSSLIKCSTDTISILATLDQCNINKEAMISCANPVTESVLSFSNTTSVPYVKNDIYTILKANASQTPIESTTSSTIPTIPAEPEIPPNPSLPADNSGLSANNPFKSMNLSDSQIQDYYDSMSLITDMIANTIIEQMTVLYNGINSISKATPTVEMVKKAYAKFNNVYNTMLSIGNSSPSNMPGVTDVTYLLLIDSFDEYLKYKDIKKCNVTQYTIFLDKYVSMLEEFHGSLNSCTVDPNAQDYELALPNFSKCMIDFGNFYTKWNKVDWQSLRTKGDSPAFCDMYGTSTSAPIQPSGPIIPSLTEMSSDNPYRNIVLSNQEIQTRYDNATTMVNTIKSVIHTQFNALKDAITFLKYSSVNITPASMKESYNQLNTVYNTLLSAGDNIQDIKFLDEYLRYNNIQNCSVYQYLLFINKYNDMLKDYNISLNSCIVPDSSIDTSKQIANSCTIKFDEFYAQWSDIDWNDFVPTTISTSMSSAYPIFCTAYEAPIVSEPVIIVPTIPSTSISEIVDNVGGPYKNLALTIDEIKSYYTDALAIVNNTVHSINEQFNLIGNAVVSTSGLNITSAKINDMYNKLYASYSTLLDVGNSGTANVPNITYVVYLNDYVLQRGIVNCDMSKLVSFVHNYITMLEEYNAVLINYCNGGNLSTTSSINNIELTNMYNTCNQNVLTFLNKWSSIDWTTTSSCSSPSIPVTVPETPTTTTPTTPTTPIESTTTETIPITSTASTTTTPVTSTTTTTIPTTSVPATTASIIIMSTSNPYKTLYMSNSQIMVKYLNSVNFASTLSSLYSGSTVQNKLNAANSSNVNTALDIANYLKPAYTTLYNAANKSSTYSDKYLNISDTLSNITDILYFDEYLKARNVQNCSVAHIVPFVNNYISMISDLNTLAYITCNYSSGTIQTVDTNCKIGRSNFFDKWSVYNLTFISTGTFCTVMV